MDVGSCSRFCRGIWVVQSLWIGAFNGSFDPGLSFGGSYHWLRGIGVLYVFGRGIGDDLSLETWQSEVIAPKRSLEKDMGEERGESPQEYVRRRIHKPGRSLKAGRKEAFVGTEEFETLQGRGMDRMRNVQKVLTGIFLSGILIGGVGTGIAMVEYSSLVYGGEKLIGEESLVTRNLDYQFEPDGGTLELAGFRYWNRDEIQEIEIDSGVPVGTVRYEVTYNEKSVSPSLVFEPYEEEEEEITEEDFEGDSDIVDENSETVSQEAAYVQEKSREQREERPKKLGYLYLTVSYHDDDFAVFMENKDRILEELKQGKVSSYNMAYVRDVKIKVNPETVPYIESRYVIR